MSTQRCLGAMTAALMLALPPLAADLDTLRQQEWRADK
jgi:hypothetical protein